MPIDLADHLAQAVKAARTGGQGFWPSEDVGVGNASTIPTIATLSDLVMFPKLYRRLVSYFSDPTIDPGQGLTGLRPSPTRHAFGRQCLGAPVGG